jgi:hypothetical protein
MSNEHVNATVRGILDAICPPAERDMRPIEEAIAPLATMGEPVKPVAGPVAAVYAKYKHLDRVFSMLPGNVASPKIEGNPFYATLLDLWTAIKAQEAG